MFLSLVGILIFAMLGTMVETARGTVCGNHGARTLRTAAEGLLTEYSRPLYDHYGLFFLEESGTPYEQVIGSYVGDTMAASGKGDMDFLSGTLTDLDIKDKVYAGDDGAAALQTEINQYMGRTLTKKMLKKFLKSTKELEDVEEEAEELEETVQQEQKLADLDEKLLELMKLIDGVTVSSGKVSCQTEFVKMYATKDKKGQNFGVTEGTVWNVMSKKIDMSTKDWEISNKTSFLNRLRRVKKLTEKAIEKGKALTSAYKKIGKKSTDEHDKMLDDLIANLPVLKRNKEVLAETETLLGEKSVKDAKKELKKLWKDYDTKSIRFDYTGVDEKGGGDDPKDSFGDAWDKGILNLVCKNPSKLSTKSVKNPDSYATYYDELESSQEDCGEKVSNFASESEASFGGILGDIGSYSMDEFCLDQYIQSTFGSYVQTVKQKNGWKSSLNYGWEYIIAGKASDQDNLKSVLNRILLIRSVVNFVALQRDGAKKKEAYAAAMAIVGFTGLAPLIKLTQTLILITWSLVESLVDVAGLLLKKHVPIVKRPSDITTNFAEVFLINNKSIVGRASKLKKAGKKSFGYKEYLQLFLLLTPQKTRRYRTMDLIQQSMIKNGYKGFQLGSCVYELTVQGTFTVATRFFRMAPIETMLGRSMKSFQTRSKVTVSY